MRPCIRRKSERIDRRSGTGVRRLAAVARSGLVMLILSCGGRDGGTDPRDAPAQLAVITVPTQEKDGAPFSIHPVVEVRDETGARVGTAKTAVSAALVAGSGVLIGSTTVQAVNGLATFQNLGYAGIGPIRLRFTATSLTPALSDTIGIAAQMVVIDSAVMTRLPDSLAGAGGTYSFLLTRGASAALRRRSRWASMAVPE